jgi:hypothetical protein
MTRQCSDCHTPFTHKGKWQNRDEFLPDYRAEGGCHHLGVWAWPETVQ